MKRGRPEKITWDKVYKEFKSKHPGLHKRMIDYEGCDEATIIIQFEDSIFMSYNYDTKECYVLDESSIYLKQWKKARRRD